MGKEGRGEKWLLPAGLKMFQEERKKKIADGIFMAVFLESDVFHWSTRKKTWKTSHIAQHYSPFLWTGFGKSWGVDSFLMSRRSKCDGPSWIVRMQVLTSISHCALSGLSSTWTPETSSSDLLQPTRVSPKVHWDSEKIFTKVVELLSGASAVRKQVSVELSTPPRTLSRTHTHTLAHPRTRTNMPVWPSSVGGWSHWAVRPGQGGENACETSSRSDARRKKPVYELEAPH